MKSKSHSMQDIHSTTTESSITEREAETTTRIQKEDNSKENENDQIMTEEDIDAFIQSEQQAASEGNNADTNSIYTP
jgi:hypothetical protein